MLKKPKPHELNGIAEIIRQSEESKARRGQAARSLILELENRRRKQEEKTGDEQIETFRRLGAI